MRIYLRKLLILCAIVLFLWCAVTLTSLFDVRANPQSIKAHRNQKVVAIETKIDSLEKLLEDQKIDSDLLLKRVIQHIEKNFKSNRTKEKPFTERDAEQKVPVPVRTSTAPPDPVLPILVIACDRVTVKRCLDNLIKFRPSTEMFPIIVSQDCGHNETYHTIKEFTDRDPSITLIQQPDLSEITVKMAGYYKIARHFKFALTHVLETLRHEAVVIVEDDLDISPDFYEYFLGTYPLLLKDPTLWCVSAWNDNGKKDLVDMSRPELLHRTDFFPGLGWMLRRETWLELRPRWPKAFFDDWLRNPENVHNRACIRPEISRTYSFGKVGVSKGLYFDVHLRYMQLNMQFVQFSKLNLSYLLTEEYDHKFQTYVYSLPDVTVTQALAGAGAGAGAGAEAGAGAVRVVYNSAATYERAAKKLGLMKDFRSGVPRTAYRGVVQCFVRGRRVFLAPARAWTRYDPDWRSSDDNDRTPARWSRSSHAPWLSQINLTLLAVLVVLPLWLK